MIGDQGRTRNPLLNYWIASFSGTTKRSSLAENVAESEVEFTADDPHQIDSAAPKFTIRGARYPEAVERMSEQ